MEMRQEAPMDLTMTILNGLESKAAAAVSEYRVVVSVEVTPTEWAPAYAWR